MSMFVTCLLAVLDVETGVLAFANAGHPPFYHCNQQGISQLRARGIPLGIICGTAYEEKEAQLSEGGRLLMFSDGLTEAHDLSDDMFGFERIQDGLEQLRHYPELTSTGSSTACSKSWLPSSVLARNRKTT